MRRLPLSLASALSIAIAVSVAPVYASDSDSKTPSIDLTPPSNLDEAIHSAQAMRAAGKLSDATQSLSQLMLVAPDDARVVGEYGKLLVQEGQAQDATQFLHRAIELSTDDWTLYSALGVAYDLQSDAADAGLAYRHALTLKPGEPAILNNIAMSRLAIGDLKGAHEMLLAAQASGGNDEQIAKNLATVEARLPKVAVIAPATTPVPAVALAPSSTTALSVPKPAPVEVAALPDAKSPVGSQADGAPRNIVMQSVPKDALAGPVAAKKWVKHRPVVAHATPVVAAKPIVAAAVPAKPTVAAAVPAKPVTAVAEHKSNKTPTLRMSADAS